MLQMDIWMGITCLMICWGALWAVLQLIKNGVQCARREK